jgi:hypothetical protein
MGGQFSFEAAVTHLISKFSPTYWLSRAFRDSETMKQAHISESVP